MSNLLGEAAAEAWTHGEAGQSFIAQHTIDMAKVAASQAEAVFNQTTPEADATVLRAARLQQIAANLGAAELL